MPEVKMAEQAYAETGMAQLAWTLLAHAKAGLICPWRVSTRRDLRSGLHDKSCWLEVWMTKLAFKGLANWLGMIADSAGAERCIGYASTLAHESAVLVLLTTLRQKLHATGSGGANV